MDGSLLRWVKEKLLEVGHLRVYVDFLIQTRQTQELLTFVLDFAKRDKDFSTFLASMRLVDESSKLNSIQKYFVEKSSIPGHFSITA